MLNFLGLIAPAFFLVVGLEYLIGKIQGKDYYRFSDAISNMCAGMAERLFDFFYAIVMLFVFKWVYDNFAIFEIPQNPFTWFLCLVVYDFMYYWYHRTGHEANFLWAVHIVHHQSEEYNFTVASRQSGFQAIARTFFLSVLPLLGFVPEFAWTVFIVGGTYQFFLHTKLIGKLGPLEYIFVTPSLHRVHHGRNDIYLDKNYGGVFIIWDMIFGTYQKEQEDIRYGITTGLPSTNVYWAYFHYWIDLFKQMKAIPKWTDKIRLFFKKPGWSPDGMKVPAEDKRNTLDRPKYDPKVPMELGVYVLIQVSMCLALLSGLLIQKGDVKAGYSSIEEFYTEFLSVQEIISYGILITMATLTIPVLLEKKKWVYYMEQIRLIIMAFCAPFVLLELSFNNPWGSLLAGAFIAFSIWLYRMRAIFLDEQYKSKFVDYSEPKEVSTVL